jgi:hypothetical protein
MQTLLPAKITVREWQSFYRIAKRAAIMTTVVEFL